MRRIANKNTLCVSRAWPPHRVPLESIELNRPVESIFETGFEVGTNTPETTFADGETRKNRRSSVTPQPNSVTYEVISTHHRRSSCVVAESKMFDSRWVPRT
jgi:hypothetical protein